MTTKVSNTVSIAAARLGQDQTNTDILNLVLSELQAIRKTLGAATAGAGAGPLIGSATLDPASHANGTQELKTITVTGAAIGDFVLVSNSIDQAGIGFHGYVSAADTVTVCVDNNAGGTVDLGSATLRVLVIPQAAAALPAMVLTA